MVKHDAASKRVIFAPEVTSQAVMVADAEIRYRVWNEGSEKPGLMFLHGFGAHSRWWDHIVPYFLDDYKVAAMDLSGFGDSGQRPEYRIDTWAQEILAVSRAAMLEPLTIVAHSYGGHATARLAKDFPDRLQRAVILDTQFWVPSSTLPCEKNLRHAFSQSTRYYATKQEALDRYRLIPPAGTVANEVLAHIAKHSVKQTSEGWTWKFDAATNPLNLDDPLRITPDGITVPIDYLYGEESMVVSREQARLYAARLATCRKPIELPGVGHHLLLENPQLLVAALRALLANPRSVISERAAN